MIPPWILRDATGRELARGGDWPGEGRSAVVRVFDPTPCSAPKPHFDGDGERDGWRICGNVAARTREGTSTGRCGACTEAERMRRRERGAEALMIANGGHGGRPR